MFLPSIAPLKVTNSALENVFVIYLQGMGHLESMSQLLQEERDFYKRECELLRNMKEKSVLMSPPTRERVTLLLFTLCGKKRKDG